MVYINYIGSTVLRIHLADPKWLHTVVIWIYCIQFYRVIIAQYLDNSIHNMWPDLPKPSTYAHHVKEQFSSSMDSSINKLTNYQYTTAKCWWVCFYWGLFLRSIRHPWALGCPLNATGWLVQAATLLEITTRLVDDIGHGFSYICDGLSAMRLPCRPFWLEIYRVQLLSATSWLPTTRHPPPLYKCLWRW